MAFTPEEWLARLTFKMDLRAGQLSLLRSYMDGNAPLPEGTEGYKEAYQDFQKKARTNFGEIIIEAVAERMVVSGFTVESPEDKLNADGTDAPDAAPQEGDNDQCRAIWKRNRLAIGSQDVFRDMLGMSAGYMIVGQDEITGKAIITPERPEQVITEQDARYPNIVIAALKVYRDYVAKEDVAFLHLPGEVYRFSRPFPTSPNVADIKLIKVQGGWEFVDASLTELDFVPVFPFLNRGNIGEFESHIDLLQRINWDILQRLVITAMQAYRQRATIGDLPEEDDEGKQIDYAKMFKPTPGALWQLPPDLELWESQQTDISPILEATKDDIRHLAAVTRTPVPMLMPDSANQSAEGAVSAREGLVRKTKDRIARANAILSRVMEAALAIENGTSTIDGSVELLWVPAESQSLAERADAASKVAGFVPWETLMTDILQFPADRVEEMKEQRTSDALMQSLAAPMMAPGAPMAPATKASAGDGQPTA